MVSVQGIEPCATGLKAFCKALHTLKKIILINKNKIIKQNKIINS